MLRAWKLRFTATPLMALWGVCGCAFLIMCGCARGEETGSARLHTAQRLVRCVAAADFVWGSELKPAGLKEGNIVAAQWTRGTIPGFLPTPDLYNVVIYSENRKHAALLFALPNSRGGFEIMRRGYVAWKKNSKWMAEGDGGPPEYEAVAKFLGTLQNQPVYKVRLVPDRQHCTEFKLTPLPRIHS